MNKSQRFLRRIYLLESMDVMLREAKYHRDNDEAEATPSVQLWKMGEEEGEAKLTDAYTR